MVNITNISINQFPITHVLLMDKEASITREGLVEINEGINDYKIEKFSLNLVEKSLHVSMIEQYDEEIQIQNPIMKLIVPEQSVSEEEITLTKNLLQKQRVLKELENTLNYLEMKQNTLKNIVDNFTESENIAHLMEGLITLDTIRNLMEYNSDQYSQTFEAILIEKQKIKSLSEEITKIETELKILKEKNVPTSYYSLDLSLNSKLPLKITLQIRYLVPAIWTPVYDLKIEKNIANISFRAIIQNQSYEDWKDISIEIAFNFIKKALIKPPISLKSTEASLENILNKDIEKYNHTKVKGQATEFFTTQAVKINIPADFQSHAYVLHSFKTNVSIVYYWNAAETDYVVIGAEFMNGDIDLLEGFCHYFMDGEIIGRGKFSKVIERNSKVKIPLAADESIIATKTLIEQKSTKKNNLYLTYKLNLINKGEKKQLLIHDVLPQSSQPNSIITMITSSISPNQVAGGLLTWHVNLIQAWETVYTIEIKKKSTLAKIIG